MFNYNLLYLFPELALKNYEPLKSQYSKNLFHKNLASRVSSSSFFFLEIMVAVILIDREFKNTQGGLKL